MRSLNLSARLVLPAPMLPATMTVRLVINFLQVAIFEAY
jgi:hypothetical protein